MSLVDTARTIARRDADQRAQQVTSRAEANELLGRARANNDDSLVDAVQRRIATLWPVKKATDYAVKLEAANEKIIEIARAVATDSQLAQMADNFRSGRINRSYYDEQYNARTKGSMEKLDAIEKEAAALVQSATNHIEALLAQITRPTGDVQQQLLNEIRTGKTWERLKSDLNQLGDAELLNAVEEVISGSADNATRAMLLEELPSYMRSRDIRYTEQDIKKTLIRSDANLINADHDETKASKFHAVVAFNVRWTRDRITDKVMDLSALDQDIMRGPFLNVERAKL